MILNECKRETEMRQLNATSSLTTGTQLQDWPSLIERLKAIAVKTRLAEAQAKRRTFQAGQLLREARTKVFEAEQRALVADARIKKRKGAMGRASGTCQ